MNTTHTLKNKNVIKLNNRKNRIHQRNKKILITCILLLTLIIIGTSLKNMYVSFRCSNFIYSLDYYFTHWKDKDLRLIEVESFSVISKKNNTVEIEAYGFTYEKPYEKTYLIGTFTQDSKGRWQMKSVKQKSQLQVTSCK